VNYVSEPSAVGQHHSSSLLKAAGREFDLTQSLRTFWRRKSLFAGIVALLMALAVVGVSAITPLYTAKTDLIIENREQKVAELKAVLGDIMPDKEGLLSELEVIQSRTIAEQVIQQLRLANDPEFNEALKPTGMLARLIADGEQALMSYLPETVFAFLMRNDKPLPTEEERRAREYEKVVDAFLERLGVSVKGQSRAIVIYFTSESPDKAARIANALADAYIVAQLDAKLEATRRANQWLSVKLRDLRKQVAQSEGAVEEYRRRAGLLQRKEGTLIASVSLCAAEASFVNENKLLWPAWAAEDRRGQRRANGTVSS
jgi:succinoglycan biosynthesis transport protein ExoP